MSPATCPLNPPGSQVAAGGAPRFGWDSFHITHDASPRVPTGARDVIFALPVEADDWLNGASAKGVRGKWDVYQWIKFKLSSDKTEILHCVSSPVMITLKI